MRLLSRFRSAAILCVAAVALSAPQGVRAERPGAAGLAIGRLGLPFSLRFLHRAEGDDPPVGAIALARDEDWKTVGFQPGEAANALYLKVAGRVQFRVAEIVFTDGSLETLPLADAVRSDGLFALTSWNAEREFLGVRLMARARSSDAHVALVLGKDPPSHR